MRPGVVASTLAEPCARYRQPWSGDDDRGRPLASGVYIAVLDDGVRRSGRRITLLR